MYSNTVQYTLSINSSRSQVVLLKDSWGSEYSFHIISNLCYLMFKIRPFNGFVTIIQSYAKIGVFTILHIVNNFYNIGSFPIVQSRELSRGPNAAFIHAQLLSVNHFFIIRVFCSSTPFGVKPLFFISIELFYPALGILTCCRFQLHLRKQINL